MRIYWILSSNRAGFSSPDRNGGETDSFQKHKDSMKKFRQAHPKIETPKPKEVVRTVKSKNIRRADLVGIVPVQRVQLAWYVQN
ncbi:hypothetical protein ES703_52951 [subsurface metagenome]